VCPACGYILEDYSRLSLEEKLVMSLSHPVLDSRMMAVRILGKLGSVQALPEFDKMISDQEADFYLLQEVIRTLPKIQHPNSIELLRKASLHSSPMVSRLAVEQLEKTDRNY
jgi:HEAT repeat protein